MTHHTTQTHASERGFTLVELAIVMIIIGLLIGGILKGQELIGNARVSSTATQAKAVESAISTFRDKYAGMPGDIANPGARIPNCTAALCILASAATNGDGFISTAAAGTSTFDPGAAINAGSESAASFVQLAAAGMIGGVDPNAVALGNATSNPVAPLGGVWQLGYSTGALGASLTGPTNVAATTLQSGTYIALTPTAGNAVPAAAPGPLTPVQAANIDRKLDDGNPNGGTIRATGAAAGAAAGNCASAAGVAGVYNEALSSSECGLYIKVQ